PRAFRYMPTYCAYLDAAGNLQNEMPLVEYAREESEGNILYYPLHVVQHIHVAGGAQDIMRWRVDQDTLTLNRRQDGRRFVIRPWPSDVVVDLNKLTRDAPEDPQWSPVGKVGFPYDLYYKNVRPEDARSQLAAVRKLPAPGSEGGRVIGAAPAQPVLVPGAP